jgi:hypothetical protein
VANYTVAIGREAQQAIAAAPFRRITESDAKRIVQTVVKDLNDPAYETRVKDLERSSFLTIFTQQAKAISCRAGLRSGRHRRKIPT